MRAFNPARIYTHWLLGDVCGACLTRDYALPPVPDCDYADPADWQPAGPAAFCPDYSHA